MKKYPLIFRLSTLGLRQHQEFDYDFHLFRTDFVGESGSGKSMIADLLQLILVGSEAFVSATESLGGKRTPDGMVLRVKEGRGTEVGYAFLNIQLEEDKFVVIGTYIESSSKATTAFAIQQGYDEDILVPLNEPLSFKDFLSNDKILPLDELIKSMEEKGLVCNKWLQKKNYYKFLFRHKLLSLDLSGSDRLLKDYATIIQSFSRGKSLDTQKGHALKNFLYGDEAAKRIYGNYQAAISEMQQAFEEHGQNKQEIALITKKQYKLSQLMTIEENMKQWQHKWLLNRAQYAHHEELRLFNDVKSMCQESHIHYASLSTLQKAMEEILPAIRENPIRLKDEADTAQTRYNKALQDHRQVEKVDDWLTRYNIGIDQLYDKYIETKKIANLKACLAQIGGKLIRSGLYDFFESIQDRSQKLALITYLDNEKGVVNNSLQEKVSYRQFWDINDRGSLGHWAMTRKTPFTMEQESVIMHFKGLMTRKPTNVNGSVVRYIPTPESLLRALSITESDDQGGWLHMNGIREYIRWVEKQVFSVDNLENIERFIQNTTADLEKEIQILNEQLRKLEKLRDIVINERDFDSYIEALNNQEAVLQFKEDDLVGLGETTIREYISSYQAKDQIESDFKTAKEAQSMAFEELLQAKLSLEKADRIRGKLDQIIAANQWTNKIVEIHQYFSAYKEIIADNTQELRYIISLFEREGKGVDFFDDKMEQHRGRLNTNSLKIEWEKYLEIKENKIVAWKEYEKVYNHQPSVDGLAAGYLDAGTDKKGRYEAEKTHFETLYKEIVVEYLENEAYKFDNVFDTIELSLALLPAAFRDVVVGSENVIDLIGSYLAKINDKNKELNKRKLQKIKDLLDDVNDEISDRITIAKQIDQFLNQENKEITGGHRVRLSIELSREYPKNWIEEFQHRLELDSNHIISEKVLEGVSLEEKIIYAFNACTSGNNGKPRIEKLLDPNAYIELNFSMRSSSGSINKGSNGQSYAGIALLCIARLSIIGSDDRRKNLPGIRFMPIDEAEGLGSNYDMLYNIAKEYGYQIISFSINPLGKFHDGGQYMYMLRKNTDSEEDVNYPPFAIFCEADKHAFSLTDKVSLS